jgi:head-tail adaptor
MNFDRRVQIERRTLAPGDFGQVETWAAAGVPLPAHRTDVSDGEKARSGETQATLMTRFVIRSSAFARGITPVDRLVSEGQAFEIVGAKERGGRRSFIELTCVSRADQ